jgi:hypothetical protein
VKLQYARSLAHADIQLKTGKRPSEELIRARCSTVDDDRAKCCYSLPLHIDVGRLISVTKSNSILAFLVLLNGCGPSHNSVAGKWTGALSTTVECSGAADAGTTFASSTEAATWIISENSGDVWVITAGPCGELNGTSDGSALALRAKTCATDYDPVSKVQIRRTFLEADVTVSKYDDVLRVRDFKVGSTIFLNGAMQSSCSGKSIGEFGRNP